MKVLSTKILEPGVLKNASAAGLQVQCIDVIKTIPASFDIQTIQTPPFDAIAFTSGTAVKYFIDEPGAVQTVQGKTIFATSGQTATELLNHYITSIHTANNAKELAQKIITRNLKSVLHICSEQRMDILEKQLAVVGIQYTPFIVYQTATLNPPALKEQFDVYLFYSPSGVESFFENNTLPATATCCCVGETTAAALKKHTTGTTVLVANQPQPIAMFQTVTEHFAKIKNTRP